MRRILDLLVREPLVHLALLGGVLYWAWGSVAPPTAETIEIESATLRALEQSQEELRGRPLTDDERSEVREGFLDDEILFREALARDLHLSNGRVRQQLTRMLRASLTPSLPEPTPAELRAYFDEQIDRFTRPATTDLKQVFWAWGEEVPAEKIAIVRSELDGGADPRRFGSTSMNAGRSMPGLSRADLVRSFGGEFADEVEALPVDGWHGPLTSVQGLHLVQIVARHPPEVARFEDVQNFLAQDYTAYRMREMQQAEIDEIRARYRIEIVGE